MSPVDVIHVITNISNIKRDDTHCLTEDLLIEMFVRYLIFRFLGGGAAPLITQEIILSQSLMPHVKCVVLNRTDVLLARITSKSEGCASFMKHVGVLIRLVKSNI